MSTCCCCCCLLLNRTAVVSFVSLSDAGVMF